ncbi:BMP family ABC transporter substrate-binding protein [Desulfohalobium retbaense]|uniref:Basic membrane lipoprotein n=1 Tax=Desulfohalobium retbaense (strain ATCC 49708 / DSM 5692 / JCM 16813 / HR100) TaxID=485915 RepID=C8WZP3_DESRD|nr:BMP family ABC transporter substrate-binding protein [Desulfohalobium retbaense]ACV67518.1 basic membrane lipoprotein [Desulfohalobium retbaense DSM 5692]
MRQISILCALMAAFLLCLPGAASAEDLKVGFIYVSPVGDAGYSYAHDLGRQAVEQMDGVTTSYVEAVPEGPDAERVLLNMSRKDFDLIFATSYGYMDSVIKVAKRFPEITYMHCSGFKRAENVGTYFGRMYQARYLTGMVAGEMTDSNVLGYVAAYPIPELIRGINAFTLGAQAVNPDVKVRVVWTKSWYDPATEKEAALSLLDVGADVIAQHVDSPAPQEAAAEKGAYSVGYNSNMAQFAPEAHLTSAVWNWDNLYPEIAEQVVQDTWESQDIWAGLNEGIIGLAPYGPMVPESVQAEVEEAKAAIQNDELTVFAGPLKDQDGTVKVPEGDSMTDEEMLGMTWFVQGVIGTTE